MATARLQPALAHAARRAVVCVWSFAHDDAVDGFLPSRANDQRRVRIRERRRRVHRMLTPNLGAFKMRPAFMNARVRISRSSSRRKLHGRRITRPDAPATGMLAWRLIGEMGVERTFEMAQCCYLALMTDTGRFQFQNTTPEAFALAGEWKHNGPKNARKRFNKPSAASP